MKGSHADLINAGEQTVTVPIIDDEEPEGEETFQLELGALQCAGNDQQRELGKDLAEVAGKLRTGHHGEVQVDDGCVEPKRIGVELSKGGKTIFRHAYINALLGQDATDSHASHRIGVNPKDAGAK